MKIKYLDMFAGIGGFRTGLTNAGDFFMPVGWCEKDKHAQKAYRLLYGTECGRRFKGPDEPMYALTTQDVHGVILLNGIIRRLMPIECFRLQGFADNQFQTLADNGISDSQLYKMAGNSVTTNVVTAIAEKLAWEINQLPNETEETT